MHPNKTPSNQRYYPALLAVLFFFACVGVASATGISWTPAFGTTGMQSAQTTLSGTLWNLDTYYHIGMTTKPLPEPVITLRFQDDGQITGLSGINRYFGQYTTSRTFISITGLGSTEMAGPEPLMNQESDYLHLLGSVKSYRMTGASLELKNSSGQVVLTFTLSDDTGKINPSNPAMLLPVLPGIGNQPVFSSTDLLNSLKMQKKPEYVPVTPPVITPLSPLSPSAMPRYSENLTSPKTYPGGPFY